MSFTYDTPDPGKFLIAVKRIIEQKGSDEAKRLIKKCYNCEISSNGQYSRRRWNEYIGTVTFITDFDTLSVVNNRVESEILQICDSIMPSDSGIGLLNIQFIPDINKIDNPEQIIDDFANFKIDNESELLNEILDDDLIEKGKELSHIYNLLFIIENSIRKLIIKVFENNIGTDYFDKINLSNQIKSGIVQRKSQEEKNAWIRIRGDSDIYYLDFIELNFIIKNNWILFKNYFPSQSWIEVKIDELYKCRCLIAHNSDIGDHEINVIKTNYRSILLQLKGKNKIV